MRYTELHSQLAIYTNYLIPPRTAKHWTDAGEKVGAGGTRHIAESCDLTRFKRAIEFNRKSPNYVKMQMGWENTCSTTFADALCDQFGMGFCPDPTGILNDVFNYTDIIPKLSRLFVECYNHHTNNETLNVMWLVNKLVPRLYQVDLEQLPIERDPNVA